MGPFVLFSLIFVGIAGAFAYVHAQKRRDWQAFAQEHGLSFGGSFFHPAIEGRYDGHDVEVRLVSRGSGNNRKSYTQYHVVIAAPMPSGFAIDEEGLLDRLGKMVGIHDITVGDPELDRALTIKGNDRVGIIRLMNVPEVGAAVLGMITVHPRLAIGQRITVEERDMANGPRMTFLLDALVDLARTFETAYERLVAEDGGASPWAAR